MAQLFCDVLGIEVSVGALTQMVAEAGGALGLFCDVIRELLIDAPAVNFDETGARVEGSLHWVHVACSSLYTLIECHKKRGTLAMDAMGVIAKMKGVAIHDGWKPYRSYDVLHQLCNSHSAEPAIMRNDEAGSDRIPWWHRVLRRVAPERFCIITGGRGTPGPDQAGDSGRVWSSVDWFAPAPAL
jgi:hypothetical protein